MVLMKKNAQCSGLAWLMAGTLLALGCSESADFHAYGSKDIQVYSVKVEKKVASDRMVGGILFHQQQAWYFKVTGPLAEMDAKVEEIRQFLSSLNFPENATKPSWILPEGWKLEEKERTGRVATLLVPLGTKTVELSITALPLPPGDETGYLLANVNRWRDQLGEPPLEANELDSLETIEAGDLKIRFVSITGQQKAGGMMPPFAS
jgi:hypothetical protein